MAGKIIYSLCLVLLYLKPGFCYIEALAAADSTGNAAQTAAPRFEPQVAVPCGSGLKGASLYPQYLSGPDKWVSDSTSESGCVRDKQQILDFCRKSYPTRNITNIVESTKITKIEGWCKSGHKKCKNTLYVRPYRCIEGAFQSEALLVPEQCVFDHIHNSSRCWSYDEWNSTAGSACRSRGLRLRSFAILLPCGVDVFSGVEFVCCPKATKESSKTTKVDPADNKDSDKSSDEDYFDSDESDDVVDEDKEEAEDKEDDDTEEEESYDLDDSDEDDDDDLDDLKVFEKTSTTTTTTTTTTVAPTPDAYLSHYDPKREHDDFLDAERRLDDNHKEKITKIMKDWTDLEDRYQETRVSDPRGAEEFKQKMTARFQKLVRALEDEGQAEKHQLMAVHQQRVLAHINVKKRDAMSCYTNALNDTPASTPKIQKCLEKLLRSLHKDRHHSIAHFRHLLKTSPAQAQREKESTAEHLADIDRMTNQTLDMLSNKYPTLSAKILPLMKDFLIALRAKDDTPAPLRDTSKDAESEILDSFKTEQVAIQEQITTKQLEKDRARKLASKKLRLGNKDEKPAYLNKEKTEVSTKPVEKVDESIQVKNIEIGSAEFEASVSPSNDVLSTVASKASVQEAASSAPEPAYVPHIQEKVHIAHAQLHDLGHAESGYSVRREIYRRENRSVYVTLAFGGIALLAAAIAGIAVLRRRAARHPHQQGFIEVDQHASPEERHVANMQVNGYENPTYKYFETKD